ncbi:hypothetical protein EYF80_044977 [Liparis tanakae]|uniref:Uncharacterized protein n=1 Tax=Liparis tanakae TaxID=230148 RepID=A0A4Z2FUC1_9TELE|nr:hypothetical protein EYF80_044977 [Liparis tanakae]
MWLDENWELEVLDESHSCTEVRTECGKPRCSHTPPGRAARNTSRFRSVPYDFMREETTRR